MILRTGETLSADFVVLAVPFDRILGLLGEHLIARIPDLAGVGFIQSSPITGIHLWFDRPVCPFDHVVTPGRLVQWVFNHTAIQGRAAPRSPTALRSEAESSSDEGQYLQVVISARLTACFNLTDRQSATPFLPTWPRYGQLSERPACCGGGS